MNANSGPASFCPNAPLPFRGAFVCPARPTPEL